MRQRRCSELDAAKQIFAAIIDDELPARWHQHSRAKPESFLGLIRLYLERSDGCIDVDREARTPPKHGQAEPQNSYPMSIKCGLWQWGRGSNQKAPDEDFAGAQVCKPAAQAGQKKTAGVICRKDLFFIGFGPVNLDAALTLLHTPMTHPLVAGCEQTQTAKELEMSVIEAEGRFVAQAGDRVRADAEERERKELLTKARDAIELGEEAFEAAQKKGASQRQIAEVLGKSAAWVNALLKWRRSGCKDTPFGPQSKASRGRADGVQAAKRNRPDKTKIDHRTRESLIKALEMLGSAHEDGRADAAMVVEREHANTGLSWAELIVPASDKTHVSKTDGSSTRGSQN